jgi:hypothetical protein
VQVVEKAEHENAPLQVVIGLSTTQAELGPGGAGVMHTPPCAPVGGGGSSHLP